MNLGAFSISLSVKDLVASHAFYEKLGFAAVEGDMAQNWIVMKNGAHVIGLFQGMFEKNILTFNPGWDQEAKPQEQFTDVRDLQAELKARGIEVVGEIDPESAGPAEFMVMDPDGNPILIDQHVARPAAE